MRTMRGRPVTFVFRAYGDSNLTTGYDTIVGFKLGSDEIDQSTLHVSADKVAIFSAGTSNTLYIEMNPAAGFNTSTDLALVVAATTAGGLKASDFVF